MIKILSFSLLLSVLLLSSCKNNNTQENKIVTIEDIYALEGELFNADITKPNLKKAQQLGKFYIEYATANPNDSTAADFLYKAADISMNINDPKLTIALFNKIQKSYPNYKNIPTIMFLRGYVYENQMSDYANARKYYMEFLDKYPNSDFAVKVR